jgi:ABC-type transporter Mla maintaining outer membrane lipid asymmetry ATPase subunit MlaF
VTEPILELSQVTKHYGGLRPLRIDRLTVAAGDDLAILGIDRPAAEVFINLVTGATLPDQGEIELFGRPSGAIQDAADWLATVDRFGIVSERAVLLDGLSVAQNLAVPFSLDIEPLPADVRSRAVASGREVGLTDNDWDRPLAELSGAGRLLVRLARALALDPAIVLLEHPTANVEREVVRSIGRSVRATLVRRGAAAVTLTADADLAAAVASRVLTLDPATGRLADARGRSWFRLWPKASKGR